MSYKMRSLSGDEMFETLAAHVLARAYRTAWRVRHGEEPVGPHVIAGLDLVIEFIGNQDVVLH
jgi:hypothetical protein